ncbi:hypothetical protein E2C01_002579 [Portunus trituberculatus]|uniref:Secreted protein n=1 Tax=Portunus trituberculatus TaxID=210409 RepID=A0A5B7CLL4_PORTR|nr:hypothetical protein [Portunus trituberculatus]
MVVLRRVLPCVVLRCVVEARECVTVRHAPQLAGRPAHTTASTSNKTFGEASPAPRHSLIITLTLEFSFSPGVLTPSRSAPPVTISAAAIKKREPREEARTSHVFYNKRKWVLGCVLISAVDDGTLSFLIHA